MERVRKPRFPALICAHRGDSFNAPENTLSAFDHAIKAGADLIECDVRRTSDEHVIVIHDAKVDRTTDGTGEVLDFDLESIKKLDAGSWFHPSFKDERLPTLDELLDLCRGKVVPMIEIKDKLAKAPRLGILVYESLKRFDMLSEAVVIIRDKARIAEFQELAPELAISMVTFTGYQVKAGAKLEGISGFDHYWKTLSPNLLAEVQAAELFITPWTVNRKVDLERCLNLQCECLLTDSTQLMMDVLERRAVERLKTQLPDAIEFGTDSADDLELEAVADEELELIKQQKLPRRPDPG